jgi:hypothetical protein
VASDQNITVYFPNNYAISSTVTCLSITIDSIALSSFNCIKSGFSVIFTNALTSLSSYFIQTVTLQIGNVLNPSPALTTG